MIRNLWSCHLSPYFSKVLIFWEKYATSVNNKSKNAIAFIPFFTGTGSASLSSELDSSELDSSFFIGAFFAGVAEIRSMY